MGAQVIIAFLLVGMIALSALGATFTNPLFAGADPGILFDPLTQSYYVTTTGGDGNGGFLPIFASTDLIHWSQIGAVFPSGSRPSWTQCDSSSCNFWAPEIHYVAGKYVVYYAAGDTNLGKMCVGAAYSDSAAGLYTDVSDSVVNYIDPSYFFDAKRGAQYLLWKLDGNSLTPHVPCNIFIQPLAADGLSVTGSKTTLITNTAGWEGDVVEGPWMVAEGGYYYLFYAGNVYCSDAYALGVARSTSPTSGFQKNPANPILKTGAMHGPGHSAIIQAASGGWFVMYAAWETSPVCGTSVTRYVCQDNMGWSNGWPVLEDNAPSRSPHTVPGPPNPTQQPEMSFAMQPDGRLVLLATSQLNAQQLMLSVQPSNMSSSWNQAAQLSKGSGVSISAATNVDGRIEAMALGTANINQPMYHGYQASADGLTQWSAWVPLTGSGHSVRMIAGPDGRLYGLLIGGGGVVYYYYQEIVSNSSSWSSPISLGGTCMQIAVGANQDGRVEIFCIGSNYLLYRNEQLSVTSDTQWSGWLQMAGMPSMIAATLAVASNELFFTVGTYWAGFIYHAWQLTPNGNWSSAVSLNKGEASRVSAARDKVGCLHVLVTTPAPKYDVYEIVQSTPGGSWGSWTLVGGECMQVALALDGLGKLQAGCIGTNSALYVTSQQGGGWAAWTRID